MIWFKKNSQKSQGENRRFERLRPEDPFLVEFKRKPVEKMRIGQGKDISRSGVRFATSASVKKGERLNMTLYFPKNYPGPRKVLAGALVHRIHDPGASHRLRVACEFLTASPGLEEALASYTAWAKTQDLTPAV